MSYTLNRIKSNRKLSSREFSRDMKRWGVLEKGKQYTSAQIGERLEKLIRQSEDESYRQIADDRIIIKSVVNHNA